MTVQKIRSVHPEALEFPFERLSMCTPNDLFYVRDHFPRPVVDLQNWSLSFEGTVSKPLKLSYKDILALPARTVSATLECAGNNRTFLIPPVAGVQWDLGAVSNATWTGVALADIIESVGLNPETQELVFEGGDEGLVDHFGTDMTVRFARSLPLDKAMNRDVLLAYAMNGEQIGEAHGFPLRLIVPGWYAVASVKWLNRIVAIDHVYKGHFQTADYSYVDRSGGEPVRVPITEMLVKALISRPQRNAVVAAGKLCEISGAAWSGAAPIARVEVSTDGGANWLDASIDASIDAGSNASPDANADANENANANDRTVNGVWTMWRFSWLAPSQPGERILMARATDAKGNVQPQSHNPDHETYMINFCFPMPVVVE